MPMMLSLRPIVALLLLLPLAASWVQQQPPSTAASSFHHHSNTRLWAAAASSYLPPLSKFCADCGEKDSIIHQVPDGDERTRACCTSCGRIEYSNPKIVVSCVVLTDDDRCLLAKRAIEPCKGTWGIPQGFMELGETTREAAAREVMEETGAVLRADKLTFRGVYNVPGSVQLLYVSLVSGCLIDLQLESSTLESSEIKLFPIDEIPYDDLAFPTVQWALDHCIRHATTPTEGDTTTDASSSTSFQPIEQRTKFYDNELEQWNEFTDEL